MPKSVELSASLPMTAAEAGVLLGATMCSWMLHKRSANVIYRCARGRSWTRSNVASPSRSPATGGEIGELIPLRRPKRFVPRADFIHASRHLPVLDADQFRADIDAAIDSSIDDPFEQALR